MYECDWANPRQQRKNLFALYKKLRFCSDVSYTYAQQSHRCMYAAGIIARGSRELMSSRVRHSVAAIKRTALRRCLHREQMQLYCPGKLISAWQLYRGYRQCLSPRSLIHQIDIELACMYIVCCGIAHIAATNFTFPTECFIIQSWLRAVWAIDYWYIRLCKALCVQSSWKIAIGKHRKWKRAAREQNKRPATYVLLTRCRSNIAVSQPSKRVRVCSTERERVPSRANIANQPPFTSANSL